MRVVLPRLARPTPCRPCIRALDQLEWKSGLAVTSHGVRLGVRTDSAELMTELRSRLPPDARPVTSPIVDQLYSIVSGGAMPDSRVQRLYVGYSGTEQFARTPDRSDALDLFEATVRFEVAVRSTRSLFVHAGAVSWRGCGIVIPAPSTHGKSRLVEALVRAGATYYSDEVAAIDRRGRLLPFARPLTLKAEPGSVRRISPREIGGPVGSKPLPIRLIVSTRFHEGTTWSPAEGERAEAVLALLVNTARARIAPAATLKTLARAVEGSRYLSGPRGEATEAAAAILRVVDSLAMPCTRPTVTPDWTPTSHGRSGGVEERTDV